MSTKQQGGQQDRNRQARGTVVGEAAQKEPETTGSHGRKSRGKTAPRSLLPEAWLPGRSSCCASGCVCTLWQDNAPYRLPPVIERSRGLRRGLLQLKAGLL